MGPAYDGLDQHRVVGVMQGQQLVALVGESGAGVLEVLHDLLGSVVDLAGGDQLVPRVVKGVERVVELVAVLGVHVLAHDRLARRAHRLGREQDLAGTWRGVGQLVDRHPPGSVPDERAHAVPLPP